MSLDRNFILEFNMFTAEGFQETKSFIHLSKHVNT